MAAFTPAERAEMATAHRRKYQALADALDLDYLKRAVLRVATLDEIAGAFLSEIEQGKHDGYPHNPPSCPPLNSIRLPRWDREAYCLIEALPYSQYCEQDNTWVKTKHPDPTKRWRHSLSTMVCLLKHVAQEMVIDSAAPEDTTIKAYALPPFTPPQEGD
jgi:hypothetical protein